MKTDCPDCDGTGNGCPPHNLPWKCEYSECHTCDGTGQIQAVCERCGEPAATCDDVCGPGIGVYLCADCGAA